LLNITIDEYCTELIKHLKGIMNAKGSVYDDMILSDHIKSNNIPNKFLCIQYGNKGPNFNMSKYYDSFIPQLNEHPEIDSINDEYIQTYFDKLSDYLADAYLKACLNMAKMEKDLQHNVYEALSDISYVKDNIYFELVDESRNPIKPLSDDNAVFNMPMFDLPHFVCQFLIKLPNSDDTIMTCRMTNSLFNKLGVSANELFKAAIKNTQTYDIENKGLFIHTPIDTMLLIEMPGLTDRELALFKQSGIMKNSPLAVLMDNDTGDQMYVLKHEFLTPLSLLFVPNVMLKVVKKLKATHEIIVIPSSKEELIVLNNDRNISEAIDVKTMVGDVNKQNVAPDEVLSDIPLKYNILTGEIYEVI